MSFVTPGRLAGLAVLVTLGALGGWQATGRDYYTKFRWQEAVPLDPDSPEAALGDTETLVWREGMRIGLLPTDGPWDKHYLSVMGLAGPAWGLAALGWVLGRRRAAATPAGPTTS